MDVRFGSVRFDLDGRERDRRGKDRNRWSPVAGLIEVVARERVYLFLTDRFDSSLYHGYCVPRTGIYVSLFSLRPRPLSCHPSDLSCIILLLQPWQTVFQCSIIDLGSPRSYSLSLATEAFEQSPIASWNRESAAMKYTRTPVDFYYFFTQKEERTLCRTVDVTSKCK